MSIAEQVGAPRIVVGGGIPFPSGDPTMTAAAERAWRKRLVARCLEALATPVDQPTVFQVAPAPLSTEAP